MNITNDALSIVLNYITSKEIESTRTVSTTWDKVASLAEIKAINERQIPLKSLGLTARKTINWLSKNPNCLALIHADLTDLTDFDNADLEKLTLKCPHIKFIYLKGTKIQGDVLKNLKNIPELLHLDISGSHDLEADALQHLCHTKNLRVLNLFQCTRLQAKSLDHLVNTPLLESLNISWCVDFEKEALKNTQIYTPYLEDLNISWCFRLNQKLISPTVKRINTDRT